jgi:hypothetical protein
VSKTSTAPLEYLRFQMMMKEAKGLEAIVAATWKRGGVPAFFKGNLTDIVRVMPSKAIQLAAFDTYKVALSRTDTVCPRNNVACLLHGPCFC